MGNTLFVCPKCCLEQSTREHSCQPKFVSCPHCKLRVELADLHIHQAIEHSKVRCRGCNSLVETQELPQHETLCCGYQPVVTKQPLPGMNKRFFDKLHSVYSPALLYEDAKPPVIKQTIYPVSAAENQSPFRITDLIRRWTCLSKFRDENAISEDTDRYGGCEFYLACNTRRLSRVRNRTYETTRDTRVNMIDAYRRLKYEREYEMFQSLRETIPVTDEKGSSITLYNQNVPSKKVSDLTVRNALKVHCLMEGLAGEGDGGDVNFEERLLCILAKNPCILRDGPECLSDYDCEYHILKLPCVFCHEFIVSEELMEHQKTCYESALRVAFEKTN